MAEWDPREFQATLQALLDRRGWSRNELAMRIGISQGVVNRWFQKEPPALVRPRPTSLEALAEIMEVPHEDLMRMCAYLAPSPARPGWPPEYENLVRELFPGWSSAEPTRRQVGEEIMRTVFNAHPPRRPNRRRPQPPEPEEDTGIITLVMQA